MWKDFPIVARGRKILCQAKYNLLRQCNRWLTKIPRCGQGWRGMPEIHKICIYSNQAKMLQHKAASIQTRSFSQKKACVCACVRTDLCVCGGKITKFIVWYILVAGEWCAFLELPLNDLEPPLNEDSMVPLGISSLVSLTVLQFAILKPVFFAGHPGNAYMMYEVSCNIRLSG